MILIPLNSLTRKIAFIAVDSTDGFTRETGVSSWTVYYSLNGGTAAAMSTPTVTELSAANMPGVYVLDIDESGMVASEGELTIHVTATGVAPITLSANVKRLLSAASLGNLEDAYDGTGYRDDYAPVTQGQIFSLLFVGGDIEADPDVEIIAGSFTGTLSFWANYSFNWNDDKKIGDLVNGVFTKDSGWTTQQSVNMITIYSSTPLPGALALRLITSLSNRQGSIYFSLPEGFDEGFPTVFGPVHWSDFNHPDLGISGIPLNAPLLEATKSDTETIISNQGDLLDTETYERSFYMGVDGWHPTNFTVTFTGTISSGNIDLQSRLLSSKTSVKKQLGYIDSGGWNSDAAWVASEWADLFTLVLTGVVCTEGYLVITIASEAQDSIGYAKTRQIKIYIPEIASWGGGLYNFVTYDGQIMINNWSGPQVALGGSPIIISAIKEKTDNLPSGIPKNVAIPAFPFMMVSDTDHITLATGLTVSGTISQDGGSFSALTNSVTEKGNGIYEVDLTQAEMNADKIILRFTATGADDRVISIFTSA